MVMVGRWETGERQGGGVWIGIIGRKFAVFLATHHPFWDVHILRWGSELRVAETFSFDVIFFFFHE